MAGVFPTGISSVSSIILRAYADTKASKIDKLYSA